jgi:hypothetical protein
MMRLKQLMFLASVVAISPVAMQAAVFHPHDACKVLPPEAFSKILGYAVSTTGSTAASCFYNGPNESGGQFMIMSESAAPNAAARMGGGGAPPPGSGLIGGMFQEGSVLFSLSIKSTDKAKLDALVAQVRTNLK